MLPFFIRKTVILLQIYVDKLCSLGLSRGDAALIVREYFKELDIDGLRAYIAELEAIRASRKKTGVVDEVLTEIGLERIS